jgi:acyl-CoA oxidase
MSGKIQHKPHPFHPGQPSNVESEFSGGTADILPAERVKATFNVEKMTNVLDGGPEKTKRRRWIISPGKNSDLSNKYFWDRPEMLRQHVRHFIEVHENFWDSVLPSREDVIWMVEYSALSGAFMNHYGLFLPTLLSQASPEQQDWWLFKTLKMEMVGCYAQTELGHGSNVRGLQTTATYDKETQEFVLNTPTLKSIKWWPGAMGKVATHALVYAQLIIDGKEYGVHSFMVQIRDDTHKPLPGIEVGDLGPKLGDHANDTGYMRLLNVRIPRDFMLNKYQHVTPEGQYVKSKVKEKNSKLHYSTMMNARGGMVKGAGGNLAKAVTIATRYSCVRRQGFRDTKGTASYKAEEVPIIDHQVQQYRIFKQIAMTYAIKFTGMWMTTQFNAIDGDNMSKNVESLPEIAATSAGLKALCTVFAWQGIEDCRKCCGGNGYLMVSGLSHLAADYVWQTTAEGDWIILMLQTARFLMKALKHAKEGRPVTGPVGYLSVLHNNPAASDFSKFAPPRAKSPQDLFNLNYLLDLFKYNALLAVASAGQDFEQQMAKSGKFDEAWNKCAIDMCIAVRCHCFAFMLSNFIDQINKVQEKDVHTVLSQLAALFACSTIIDDPGWIGTIDAQQLRMVKAAVVELLELLRPNAVPLVDAFEIPDRVLNSAIGRHDGNVYEALYEMAQKSPLNLQDPFVGYEEFLRPHLDLESLKRGNAVPRANL